MLLFLLLTIFADSSWVRIQTMPTEVILVLNEDLSNPIAITSGDSLKLPVGRHAIRVTHPSFSDSEGGIEVLPNQTLDLRVDLRFNATPIPNNRSTWFVLRNQANLFVKTDADTRIFLNGEEIGRGEARRMLSYENPLSTLELRRGRVKKRIQLNTATQRTVLINSYLAPRWSTYLMLAPVPGAAQWYERKYATSLLLAASTVVGVRAMQDSQDHYDFRKAEYNALRLAYSEANDFDEADRLGQEMTAYYPHLERSAQLRDISVAALSTVLAIHLLDVAIPPKYGFRKVTVRTNPYQTIGAEIHLGF